MTVLILFIRLVFSNFITFGNFLKHNYVIDVKIYVRHKRKN